jgi:hypothetical protein
LDHKDLKVPKVQEDHKDSKVHREVVHKVHLAHKVLEDLKVLKVPLDKIVQFLVLKVQQDLKELEDHKVLKVQ